jgi:hypothetical protein
MTDFYAIHLRPWLIAGRSLLPHRSFLAAPAATPAERSMNVLGLKISVDHAPTARVKWTRRTGAMAGATALVVGGGIAYANWSTNGTGVGAAKAGTAAGVNASVTTTSTSATLLVPGGTAPVIVNIHNPNTFSVKVSAVSVAVAATPDSVTGGTGCTTANALVSLAAASSSGLSVAIAGGGDGTVTLPGSPATMGLNSDNGCQGATFNFTTGVTVTAAAG